MSDDEETPRPTKRYRNFDGDFHFSPTLSYRSDSIASVTSHKSGRFSPVKQVEAQKDLERLVIVCHLESADADSEQLDVAAMQTAT